MEKTSIFEHPATTLSPFIKLSDIKMGNKMICRGIEQIVACSPIDVSEGAGSFFNSVYFSSVYEKGGKIFIDIMVGRSNPDEDIWIYTRNKIKELKQTDPNYQKAKDLLNRYGSRKNK